MQDYDPHISAERRQARQRSGFKKVLPFVIIGGITLFIASNEIPGFRHAIDYYVSHDRWQASESCMRKALQLGSSPDFVRIIKQGDVYRTEKGFFIENIIVGEMAEQGGERQFTVDCYTDSDGNIVRADRRQPLLQGKTGPS
jgi:hypothetical protein